MNNPITDSLTGSDDSRSIDAHTRARVLTEALPYIRRYQGKTIVIKYGGSAMVDEDLRCRFADDVILLKLVGMNPVIVHGGGPQISRALDKIGKPSTFVDGMRVTDDETMEVVEMVLGGLVNQDIVSLINTLGGRAVGLTGKDGGLIRARKLPATNGAPLPGQPGAVDYGRVGEVQAIDPGIVQVLTEQHFIPVIAPIGVGDDGRTYNINADLVAGNLAATLGAEKLVLLTNTPGVRDRQGELIPELKPARIRRLIADGIIVNGMLPKVNCALAAVKAGVGSAVIVDGRIAHALLLELFTDTGVGTQLDA